MNASETKTESQLVAATIAQQLGGFGKLKAMVGAYNFLYGTTGPDATSLSFRFKGCRKYNYLRVQLDANDTYTVTFGKVYDTKLDYKKGPEVEGVYCDQLIPIFQAYTGLYLYL